MLEIHSSMLKLIHLKNIALQLDVQVQDVNLLIKKILLT